MTVLRRVRTVHKIDVIVIELSLLFISQSELYMRSLKFHDTKPSHRYIE